jgi:hypothetical protein
MIAIELEWPVATQYVVEEVPPTAERAIRVAEKATIRLCRPFDGNPSLYAEFASLDGSEKACLNFAHRYGTLFYPDKIKTVIGNPGPDSFRHWKERIKGTKDLIRRCQLSRTNPEEAFRQFAKKDRRLFSVEVFLSIKSSNSPATLEMRPESLYAAIELQTILSIIFEGRQPYECIECNKPFTVGIGARRSQSKFCSRRCKDTYHNRLKALSRRNDHA